MTKRITISVPDELFSKLSELKDELSDVRDKDGKVSRKISTICQQALNDKLRELEASRSYRVAGIEDGIKVSESLSESDKKHILKIMSGSGPYKKWSRYERVSELVDQIKGGDLDKYAPRFTGLADGDIKLNDWVDEYDRLAEDRRNEMSWSYMEGCFEGIVKAIAQDMKNDE